MAVAPALALLLGTEALAAHRPARPVAPTTTAVPLPLPRPADAPAAPATEAPSTPDPVALCHARLSAAGLRFQPATAPDPAAPGCSIAMPVRVEALVTSDGTRIDFVDRPLVECPFAEALAGFAGNLLAPLVQGRLGTKPIRLTTGPGFECRPRNRVAGAKLSAHGQGRAVDIHSFELADGRRIVIGAPADDGQKQLVDAVRRAACGWFTTVLGPGSNAAHADHLHLDREPRGRSGEAKLCE
jgi:hypothetical protein